MTNIFQRFLISIRLLKPPVGTPFPEDERKVLLKRLTLILNTIGKNRDDYLACCLKDKIRLLKKHRTQEEWDELEKTYDKVNEYFENNDDLNNELPNF